MRTRSKHWSSVVALTSLTVACGGGGGSSTSGALNNGAGGGSSNTWVQGQFAPASNFAAQCVAPRGGINPDTGRNYPDRPGTVTAQNNFLRSWSNDLYLWYNEIIDRDPGLFQTPAYFDQLKSTALTSSGQPKDRFHFTMDTEAFRQLSESGVSAGYGMQLALISAEVPRLVRVAYVEANSPAANSTVNVQRGARIVRVDGVDVETASSAEAIDTLNDGLFPDRVGISHTFTIEDFGASTTRDITLTSVEVTSDPVPVVATFDASGGKYGYLLFNDHIATAERELVAAVNQLQSENITDLILDIRYNGGGFLDIASQLAYMIAGPARTQGRAFEQLRFNDKHQTRNPVTGQTLSPELFASTTVGLSLASGTPLPSLNLARVFVLTGPDTCSASETIINGLRGISVDVIQIGTTTCGKPYGFYPQDNCGTTYFSIQFRGDNDRGFGDYPDGFTPTTNAQGPIGVAVPGCYLQDDFSRPLGDPAERRLAVALDYSTNGCPIGITTTQGKMQRLTPMLRKPEALRGMFYLP